MKRILKYLFPMLVSGYGVAIWHWGFGNVAAATFVSTVVVVIVTIIICASFEFIRWLYFND